MAKPELGTKRHCPNCGTRYYDLNRDPILCPKCGTVFEASAVTVRERAAKLAAVAEDEAEIEEEIGDVELVPLEEADGDAAEAEDVPDDLDDGAIEPLGEDDDTFLEEEDEGDDDVTDIIGDVDEEEER